MAKYELIKEYPNSPPLGTTIEKDFESACFVEGVLVTSPESFPEYWRAIPEVDYEVLEGQVLIDLEYSFNKVKRLSDGKVFKIGDEVYIKDCPTQKCKINRFYLNCNEDKMLIAPLNVGLDKIEHRECLFTTEDGVKIYEGMRTYLIIKDSLLYSEVSSPYSGDSQETCWYFFSKEKAEEFLKAVEFIRNRTPLFTTEDGVDIYSGQDYWGVCINPHWYAFSEKWDICKNSGNHAEWKTFSTEKKAKEYVDMNKPKYSKEDVVEILADFHYTVSCGTPLVEDQYYLEHIPNK